ncbi:MAG: 50S ribosomal protein L35 [Verrucomicrobia bacterium]|nr:50S ribosomal protein L35 [Verrucomicrobiota bacterium]MDA1087484.1 50S ribosomal protein L35 [Verrucomicrobiota bacterium]
MPKQKTSKTAAKRFRRTATGKFKFTKAGSGHLNASKSTKRKRRLRSGDTLAKCEQKRIEKMI